MCSESVQYITLVQVCTVLVICAVQRERSEHEKRWKMMDELHEKLALLLASQHVSLHTVLTLKWKLYDLRCSKLIYWNYLMTENG